MIDLLVQHHADVNARDRRGVTVLANVMASGAADLAERLRLIPSGDAGIELFVRDKHPASTESFPSDRILLYVHGATYPSETAFDLPIEAVSMMDMIAARGFDVYLVDVRGYGRSTRPPEMSQPPAANKPIVSRLLLVTWVPLWITFLKGAVFQKLK